MEKIKVFFQGFLIALVLGGAIHGGITLWGFRNDYLALRASHVQVLRYLSEPITVNGKKYSRADVLAELAKSATTPVKKD